MSKTDETVEAVLALAREGGWISTEPSEGMRLEAAAYFIAEARKFLATGEQAQNVEGIAAIAAHELPETGPWEPMETNGVDPPSSTEGDPETQKDAGESAAEHDPDPGDRSSRQEPEDARVSESPVEDGAIQSEVLPERPAQERDGTAAGEILPGSRPPAASLAERDRLPIPSQIEGEPHEMPLDVTAADDKLIRRLHGEYGAFVARTTWLLAQAGQDYSNALHLRDEAARNAVRQIPKIDDETGKAKLAMHISAERDEDPEVKKWDAKVRSHERDIEELKALKEIYAGYVTRLSREMSMRNDEFSRGGR